MRVARLSVLSLSLCTFKAPALAQAVDSTKNLSFYEAIERATQTSPRRDQSQAEYDMTVAQTKKTMSNLGPKVKLKFSQNYFDKNVSLPFGTETFLLRPDKLTEGSIEVTQPLTGLLTVHKQTKVAKQREESSMLGLEQTNLNISFDTATAYIEAQASGEQVKIVKTSVTATESQLKDAESLTKLGRLNQSDLLKMKIARQEAKAQFAKANAQNKKAIDRLLYLTNLPTGTVVQLDVLPEASIMIDVKVPSLEPNIEKAELARIDFKQASSNVEAAEQYQQLTRLKFIPTIDLYANWSRIYSIPPFGNPTFTRSFGINASWDIWENGSRVFETRESAAQIQKANAMLQETKDRIKLEIQALTADIEAAREALSAAKAAVDQSEEAYRLDKARFSNGLVTTTDLLLSEATRTRTKGALITTLTNFSNLLLNLQKATGVTKPQVIF